MTRLYLPGSLDGLAAALPLADVAPDRDEAVVAADESEEAEYAALMTAADASAELVAGGRDGRRRRVVVVAEPATADGPVAWRDVVAVHVDAADDADPDDDLAWYATQEIPFLLE